MSEEKPLFTDLPDKAFTPSEYNNLLLEQYKLYVEMMDRVSSRRLSANTYYLSVDTALLGYLAHISSTGTASAHWILGIAGMALSILWARTVASYRDLNTGKFVVIHNIEERLPLRLYASEWAAIGKGTDPQKYNPLSHLEIGVPIIFLVLHFVVTLYGLHAAGYLTKITGH